MQEATVSVLRLKSFDRRAKKLFDEDEIDALAEFIAQNPEKGDVIPGTGGLRKLRWALGNQGKRGGSRVIYYYHQPETLILLLTAYAKSQKEDLTSDEKKALQAAVEAEITSGKKE